MAEEEETVSRGEFSEQPAEKVEVSEEVASESSSLEDIADSFSEKGVSESNFQVKEMPTATLKPETAEKQVNESSAFRETSLEESAESSSERIKLEGKEDYSAKTDYSPANYPKYSNSYSGEDYQEVQRETRERIVRGDFLKDTTLNDSPIVHKRWDNFSHASNEDKARDYILEKSSRKEVKKRALRD